LKLNASLSEANHGRRNRSDQHDRDGHVTHGRDLPTGRQAPHATVRAADTSSAQPQRHRAIIGIGSNIDPAANVPAAIERIAAEHELVASTPPVRTAPIGTTDQPDFVNCAALIRTGFDREHLQAWLKSVESDLGRVRTDDRNGPRTIDLDIIVWDGQVVDADVYEREFLRDAVRQLWPEVL
jgi:2-amino-4-hydroxy-6-hydroxymethyldihydropteridine diphosphokinase